LRRMRRDATAAAHRRAGGSSREVVAGSVGLWYTALVQVKHAPC